MLADPVVSVIVPAHNYGHVLRETIESVRAQTFTSWECIVIDDGSTDDTRKVLDEVAKKDGRIRCYSQTQQGPSPTRNRGLALSRGRYVQFLDADDLLDPYKLERHVAFLDRSDNIDIVYGPTRYFDDGDPARTLRDTFRRGETIRLEPPARTQVELVERLVARNIMTIEAPLVRSSVFDKVGRFDATLRRLEDWDLWLRCALMGIRFEYLPSESAVALIRVHAVSLSASRGPMLITEARLRHRFRRQLPAALRPMNRRALRNAARAGALEAAVSGAPLRGLKIALFGAYASRDVRLVLVAVPLAIAVVPGGRRLVTAVRERRRRGRQP